MARRSALWIALIFVGLRTYIDAYMNFKEKKDLQPQNTPLVYLTSATMENGGNFSISLSLVLERGNLNVVQNRTMLYLLACDDDAYRHIINTGWTSGEDREKENGYICSEIPTKSRKTMLHTLCDSYALDRLMPRDKFGRVDKHYQDTYVVQRNIQAFFTPSNKDGKMHLFIDGCETIGGALGALPSCMMNDIYPCFTCFRLNKNNAMACQISPPIEPAIQGSFIFTSCNRSGQCTGDDYKPLAKFYLVHTSLCFILLSLGIALMKRFCNEYTAKLAILISLILLSEVGHL